MANYSLLINSTFNPMSFEQLAKPFAMYGDAYKELENAYSAMETEAAVWENRINKETDPYAAKQYLKYADDLRARANTLATQGLTPGSRRNMLEMKRRYASEITPISEAYQNRAALAKALLEAMLKDPTHMFAQQANTVSLDEYLKNPNYDAVSTNYSGALLTSQVANQALALAKELRDYGKGKPIDAYTNTFLLQHGFSRDQVLQAINDPNRTESQPVLNALVESVIGASGIKGWNNLDTLNKAYNYAREGLWQAVGQSNVSPIENFGARQAAKEASERRTAAYKAGLENADLGAPRHMSILLANGDLQGYTNLHSKLTLADSGGLSSHYFGKTFNNPMKIYEEYHALAGSRNSFTTGSTKGRIVPNIREQQNHQNAEEEIKKKYGIKHILTSQEYQQLSDLGFNSKSSYSDFRNNMTTAIDKRAKQFAYSSVNLSNLKQANKWVSGELQYRNDKGTLQNSLWEFNNDGTQGKPIKDLDDIDLSKLELNDVFYSRQNPDKIVMQIGSTRYLADASLISEEARQLIGYSNSILKADDASLNRMIQQDPSLQGASPDDVRDAIYESTTQQLRSLLKGFNKQRSETDSKE